MHKIQAEIIKLAKKEDIGQYGYRKLGEKIHVSHPQQVKYHLQRLIESGRLIKTPFGVLRVATPSKTISQILNIPILGQANCGEALSYAEETKWGNLTLSPSVIKTKNTAKLFAVRAVGQSMNRANLNGQSIEDGDYVVVDGSTELPSNGDYVVSSIGGLANIKKYLRDEKNKLIRLLSESTQQLPPIVIDPNDVDSYHIHGRVISVIKV